MAITPVNTIASVVLDLNGDGVMSYSQIKMDMNDDGVLDTTAWVGSQDGVLVRDSFGDGFRCAAIASLPLPATTAWPT